jgi:hypothetical protein
LVRQGKKDDQGKKTARQRYNILGDPLKTGDSLIFSGIFTCVRGRFVSPDEEGKIYRTRRNFKKFSGSS